MTVPRRGAVAGSVLMPEPYNRRPSYPTYAERVADDVLVGYRNWRSTMSGHPECDGRVAVGLASEFASLRDFMNTCRGALSIQWGAADTVPGTAWTANEQRYPVEERESEDGPELVQLLAVHRVGWLDVYDDPALMYVAGGGNGVHVGVWITNKQGGARRAVSLVQRIRRSFERA